MSGGWIKLHRKFTGWQWYQLQGMVHLFIHLLLHANHEPKKWQKIQINRGQLVTGRKVLSSETGISEQSVRTILNNLKSTNEITIESTNRYSIITICNYNTYQKDDREDNQQINQQANQQSTSSQPAINHKQELKELKELKNKETTFDIFWKNYPKKVGKGAAIKAFNKVKQPIEILLKAIENQKQSEQWKKQNGQFIPNPSTWLNQGRWDDEPETKTDKVNWDEVDKLTGEIK